MAAQAKGRRCAVLGGFFQGRPLGGGRSRKLPPYQEVLLTLIYLRHNASHTPSPEPCSASVQTLPQ